MATNDGWEDIPEDDGWETISGPTISPSQRAKQDTLDEEPWYTRALIGAGEGVESLRQGAADLGLLPDWIRINGKQISEVTEQDRRDLAESQQTEDFAKSVGGFTGDVATYAVPGAGVGRALQVARPALSTGRAMLAGDLAATAAIDYTRAPQEGTTRGENAAIGAGSALAGAGLARTLSKMAQGMNLKEGAKELLDEGIPLTPGMASDSRFVKWAERRAGDVPGVAGTVAKRQHAAQRAWNNKLINDLNPGDGLGRIDGVGHEAIEELQGSFSIAYQQAWQKVDPTNVNLADLSGDWQRLVGDIDRMVPNDMQGEAGRILANAEDLVVQFGQTGNTKFLERADDMLRDAAYAADGDAQTWFGKARKALKNSLPEGVSERLTEIDDKYADYKVLERASTYKGALDNDGVFTPSQLTSAVKSKGGDYRLAGGDARMQEVARKGRETIDGFVPKEDTLGQRLTIPAVAVGALIDPVTTGTALAVGNAAFTEGGRRLALGQTGGQALARAIRDQAGSAGLTGARVGAAYANALRGPVGVSQPTPESERELNELLRELGL